MQEELKDILEQAAQQNASNVQAKVKQVRKLSAGCKFSDCFDLFDKIERGESICR